MRTYTFLCKSNSSPYCVLFVGYGCWLSGIDVSTQMLNQNFQDPFVAIVVDPVRTISAGKVNLGAFRWVRGYCVRCVHLFGGGGETDRS